MGRVSITSSPNLTFFLVKKYKDAPKLVAKISPGTSAPEYWAEAPLKYVNTIKAP